jgi:F-type H+-transporting ATPase subunit delta
VKDVTVSGRYAQALFLLTERRKETAPALEDLKGVRDLLAAGSRVGMVLAAPQLRLADKRKMLADAFAGRANRSVAAFVDLLLRKKRLALLAEITGEFEALVERSQGVRRAHVVSAVPLSEAERKRLIVTLEGYTRGTIKLTQQVDPSVVGGALVRIGDRVVDRTVRTLLESIATQLHEVSV